MLNETAHTTNHTGRHTGHHTGRYPSARVSYTAILVGPALFEYFKNILFGL